MKLKLQPFLVAFMSDGVLASEVMYLSPENPAHAALTLMMLLPDGAAWVSATRLQWGYPLPSGDYESHLAFVVGSSEENSLVFSHDMPLLTSDDFRDVEEIIRATLQTKAPVCVVGCEPVVAL